MVWPRKCFVPSTSALFRAETVCPNSMAGTQGSHRFAAQLAPRSALPGATSPVVALPEDEPQQSF